MKRKSSVAPHAGHSLKLAFLFVSGVAFLILLSFVVRACMVIRESSYDASHRFTIAAQTSPTDSTIYSFDKPSNTIAVLHVSGLSPGVSVAKATSVLVDGTLPSASLLTHGGFISSIPDVLFFHKTYNGMTGYDIGRLAAFLSMTPPGNITTKTLRLPASDAELSTTTANLFIDSSIVKENKSIRIINATGVSGVGTRLEEVLSNAGATVIAIDGDDTVVPDTTVVSLPPISYTARKISAYLHVTPKVEPGNGLSDIIVTLGKDALKNKQF